MSDVSADTEHNKDVVRRFYEPFWRGSPRRPETSGVGSAKLVGAGVSWGGLLRSRSGERPEARMPPRRREWRLPAAAAWRR